MPAGQAQLAKRAFVAVLLELCKKYSLETKVFRDSPEADVLKEYRRLLKKAHPDKGGAAEDTVRLNDAKEAWDKASTASFASVLVSSCPRCVLRSLVERACEALVGEWDRKVVFEWVGLGLLRRHYWSPLLRQRGFPPTLLPLHHCWQGIVLAVSG